MAAISAEVLGILGRATVDGPRLVVTDRLDRPQYVAVNKVLEAAGGKWSRRDRAHVFQGVAGPVLAGLLGSGEVATPQEAGWFPTPPAVVSRILDAAGIEPGGHQLAALEPSAGTGAIAARAAGYGYLVDCVEMDAGRAGQIPVGVARSVTVADFLAVEPRPEYDRVLMNPPFAGKADIAHVLHALRFLRPGGVLVSVMSAGTAFRQDKRTAGFRDLVEQAGGVIEDLPGQAFRESGTDVRTVLVTVPAIEVAGPEAVPAAEAPRKRGKLTTDEKRAYVDAKRERVAAMMADGMEQMTDPAVWAQFLSRGSSLGRYSFRNQMLIGMQCPVASDVAGFVEWQDRGRQVREGEDGLLIFAPRTKAAPASGEDRAPAEGEATVRKMCGVKIASVFDISQTDPMPGRVFKPAKTAQGKTLTEIREALAGIGGGGAAAVLAAMDAGVALAVQAAAERAAAVDEDEDGEDLDGYEVTEDADLLFA